MRTLQQAFKALTRQERILLGVACFGLVLGAGFTGLRWFANATSVVPAQGGTFTEGMVGQPTYVNPILAESDPDRALTHLVFSNILTLAESIEPDETGKTWTIRLKENLRWSDEKKLTSDDIIFTVQKIQEPATRSPLFSSWQGVAANRTSEIELQFVLVSPYPFFKENLRNLYPVPKHLFADTPPANWRLSDFNLEPIGSGPYSFSSYERRSDGFVEAYELKRNKLYAATAPHLDQIIFRFFPRGEELMDAFNGGTIDGFGKFDPEAFTHINRSYQMTTYAIPSYYAVFLNQSQSIPLKETSVRKALAQSIDRKALVDDIFGGYARIAHGPIVGEAASERDEFFLPSEAIETLESAGWMLGASGIREKSAKNGTTTLSFDIVVPKIGFLESTAAKLIDSWRSIGVRANLIVLPPEEVVNRVIKNREYQAVLFGNYLNPAFDLYPFWHTNERFAPGLNLSLLSDRRVDESIEGVRREIDDAKRATLQTELLSFIADAAPAVFLYSPDYRYAVNRDLRGLQDTALAEPADRFLMVSDWHLKTTRAFK